MKRLLLAFAVLSLAVASAKSYTLNLYQAAMLGQTELKPGTYTVEVKDQKAVIRNGKLVSETPVKVEAAESKFNSTSVRFTNGDGKMHIREIRLGGTNTKLVFAN
jgi:hypothetical protein